MYCALFSPVGKRGNFLESECRGPISMPPYPIRLFKSPGWRPSAACPPSSPCSQAHLALALAWVSSQQWGRSAPWWWQHTLPTGTPPPGLASGPDCLGWGRLSSGSSSSERRRLLGDWWTLGMVTQEGGGRWPVPSMAHQRSSGNMGWMDERMSKQIQKWIVS